LGGAGAYTYATLRKIINIFLEEMNR